jgi:hypothetical protein
MLEWLQISEEDQFATRNIRFLLEVFKLQFHHARYCFSALLVVLAISLALHSMWYWKSIIQKCFVFQNKVHYWTTVSIFGTS